MAATEARNLPHGVEVWEDGALRCTVFYGRRMTLDDWVAAGPGFNLTVKRLRDEGWTDTVLTVDNKIRPLGANDYVLEMR